jgi:four helix bundle protein
LVSQMRRCAVSVPSNIVEGAARNTNKEFINFLHIAKGSLASLDTQLEISLRLNFIDKEAWRAMDRKLLEIGKMLTGLIKSIKKALRTFLTLTPQLKRKNRGWKI